MTGFLLLLNSLLGLLNGDSLEDFESLSLPMRFALPLLGSLVLIALYRWTPSRVHNVGIAHVIDRLQRGRGKLAAGNAFFQLAAAIVALGSGHSVGKEGPAVHIGAGIANQLGQRTHRVPSQLRLLIGCGTAAAISSAFDTPLAGVLFAMEVVLMEYSLLGFTPIIAAAVTASATSRWLIGEHPSFIAIELQSAHISDWPLLVLTGLAIGLLAVAFHHLVRLMQRHGPARRSTRLLLAGLLVGSLATLVPEILGSGFDTVNQTLSDPQPWQILALILIAKIIATACAVGLGIPAGVIGPILVIGACGGALMAAVLPASDMALYALLGMAGMMSAVLHAPLAALAAVLELSLSAQAMFPAMIVVLSANLVCQHGFRLPSLFRGILEAQGLSIQTHPVRTALAQRYLSELGTRQFDSCDPATESERIATLAKSPYRWVVLQLDNKAYLLARERLTACHQDWIQLEADIRPPFAEAVQSLIGPYSRLHPLTEDITLLEAVKSLQQEETAGFLLPLDDGNTGLVTRAQLVSVLTSEGDIQ
ncbi:chloride channel protein [Saccharospirillum sp. HFRX-1]|uniref:chloride channel protein n=1 Tax=unclassified Saccharospirillum TaxID=2633430 RepID=UPI0037210A4A